MKTGNLHSSFLIDGPDNVDRGWLIRTPLPGEAMDRVEDPASNTGNNSKVLA